MSRALGLLPVGKRRGVALQRDRGGGLTPPGSWQFLQIRSSEPEPRQSPVRYRKTRNSTRRESASCAWLAAPTTRARGASSSPADTTSRSVGNPNAIN